MTFEKPTVNLFEKFVHGLTLNFLSRHFSTCLFFDINSCLSWKEVSWHCLTVYSICPFLVTFLHISTLLVTTLFVTNSLSSSKSSRHNARRTVNVPTFSFIFPQSATIYRNLLCFLINVIFLILCRIEVHKEIESG